MRAEEASQDDKIKEHGEDRDGKGVQSSKTPPAAPTSYIPCWPPLVSDRLSLYRHRVISLTTHVQPRVSYTPVKKEDVEVESTETSLAKDDAPAEPAMQRIRMDLPVADSDWTLLLLSISVYIPSGESDEWLEDYLLARYFQEQRGDSSRLGRHLRTWIGFLLLIRDSVGTTRDGAVVCYPGDLEDLDGYISRYNELWAMERYRRASPGTLFCGYPAKMAAWVGRGQECVPHFCDWFADFPKTLANVTIVVPVDDPKPRTSIILTITMANTVDVTYRARHEPLQEFVVTPLSGYSGLPWEPMVKEADLSNQYNLTGVYEFCHPEKRLLTFASILRRLPARFYAKYTGYQRISCSGTTYGFYSANARRLILPRE